MIFQVSNAAQLVVAAANAAGGDTILLAPGTYSDVTLKSLSYSSNVTITSADLDHPAVLRDMDVSYVKGLTIENVSVVSVNDVGLKISSSQDITVDHIDVTGTSTTKPAGNGVKAANSVDVVIKNSSFHDLQFGVTHVDSKHVTISGNMIENIGADGIRGGGTSWIEISGNVLRNFYRDPGVHADAIQFWTKNTTASAHDIVVKDNLIERGEGNRMQGIFFGDETKGKLPYINVEVSGNTVLGTMYNGINLYPAKHAVVSGNTVIGYDDMNSSIRVDGSTDVKVTNNISSNFALNTDVNIDLVSQANKKVAVTNAKADDAYVQTFLKAHPLVAASKAGAGIEDAPAVVSKSAELMMGNIIMGDKTANTLTGGKGADLLDGGKGADNMAGGAGNDIYNVDNSRDTVVETARNGNDTVNASVNYKLGANLENLNLTDNASQTGTGNELNNVIRGNWVESKLSGEAGDDTIASEGGNDTLSGGAGQDTFRFEGVSKTGAVITDFVSGQDHLDLHVLLEDYKGNNPLTAGWVKVQADAKGDVSVLVDIDGPHHSGVYTTLVTLTGVKALAASDWIF